MKSTRIPLLLIFSLSLLSWQPATHKSVAVVTYAQVEELLNSGSDTTYIINFWATWCKPCVMELPDFEKIEEKYLADTFVKVILVSLDFPEKIESDVIPFMKRRNIISEVWLLDAPDANAWIDRVDPSWSGAIPATVIVNSGYRFFHEGMMNFNELDSIITKHKYKSK